MRKPPFALIGAAFIAAFAFPTAAHGQQPTSPSACNPAYVSPCLPIDHDVNCPDLTEQVHLKQIGVDPYDLDRNHDGIGCNDNPPSTAGPTDEPSTPHATTKTTTTAKKPAPTAVKAAPKFTG